MRWSRVWAAWGVAKQSHITLFSLTVYARACCCHHHHCMMFKNVVCCFEFSFSFSLLCFRQSDMLCYVEESWRNVSHGSEVANGRMKHFFRFRFACAFLSYAMYICWLTCTAYFFITWRHFWHNLLSVPFFFGLLGSFLLFLKGSFFSQVIHFALSHNWLDIQSGTLFFSSFHFLGRLRRVVFERPKTLKDFS